MATRKRQPSNLAKSLGLVPKHVRDLFDQVSLCVDVKLAAAQMSELRRLISSSGEALYYAATPSTDLETAFVIQWANKSHLHVTVEYRRKMSAPYPRTTVGKLSKIVDLIRKGTDMRVVHASYSYGSSPDVSPVKPFPPVRLPSGETMKVTGLEFEFESETGRAKRGGRLRYNDGGSSTTMWSREELSVGSIEEAFEASVKRALTEKAGGQS